MLDDKKDLLILQFEQEISVGEATLSIEYAGVFNDKMTGFYRSTYSVGQEEKLMASTQVKCISLLHIPFHLLYFLSSSPLTLLATQRNPSFQMEKMYFHFLLV